MRYARIIACLLLVVPATASAQDGLTDARPPVRQEDVLSSCRVPAPPADAEVLLVGAGEGQLYSSVHLGDPLEAVTHAEVAIEDGATPLYVMITELSPMVWSFTGDVSRVTRVVMGGQNLGGVVGIARDRISYLVLPACLGTAWDFTTSAGSAIEIEAERLAGRLSRSGGDHDFDRISIPSMTIDRIDTFSGTLPRGHVDVDPSAVVATTPVAAYDVLPGQAGLEQLVREGRAETDDGLTYRIVQWVPHFPAGLDGAYAVRFSMSAGVPPPAAKQGYCVIDETTGAALDDECSD